MGITPESALEARLAAIAAHFDLGEVQTHLRVSGTNENYLVSCTDLPEKRHWIDEHYLPEAIEAAVHMYGAERLRETLNVFHSLEHFQPATFPQSIVHGDLDPSNCLFEGEKLVAFVDWQEIGVGAALMDFVQTALGFCFVDQLTLPVF